MGSAGKVRVAVALAFCFATSACTGTRANVAGSHRFAVPERNRIPESDRPFFLPPSEDDGFAFVLNPAAAPPNQIVVRVDTKANICRAAAGTKAYVNATVCSATPLRWRGQELRRSGDKVFWTYTLPRGDQATLISCFQVSGAANGLCTASVPFGDLVLILHIDHTDVGRLAADYDTATALLRSWER